MMGQPFEYRFYLDFSINGAPPSGSAGHLPIDGEDAAAAAAEAALSDLEEASAEIKLFGTYPSA